MKCPRCVKGTLVGLWWGMRRTSYECDKCGHRVTYEHPVRHPVGAVTEEEQA